MASEQAKALMELMKMGREALAAREAPPTLEEQREGLAATVALLGVPAEGVTVTETYAGGSRAYWNDVEGGSRDRAILYLHGGGYVLGSPKTHEKLTGHLARAVGCRVLSLDYRLAPEHPHPAAVEDATAAYRWLLDQGFEPRHLAISGDSAGGGLTLATLLSLREEGLPQPAGAVPLSPWTDMEGTGESMTANADKDLLVQREGLLEMAAAFLGEGSSPRDPLAAPVHGDYAGVAPIYIQVGGDEMLLDDSTRIVERVEAAGGEVKLDAFPEMQHVFQAAAGQVPEADDAIQRIAAWLRPRLGL